MSWKDIKSLFFLSFTKRKILSMFLYLLVSYAIAVSFLYLMQRVFLFHPDHSRPVPSVQGVPEMSVVTVETGDGLEIQGWYKAPAAPEKPVVILFHGNGGHYGHRAFMAKPLMDADYGYLLAGYRGYGGNPGSPGEEAFYKDARLWINWLIGAMNIPQRRIVLAGESLGTGVAVQMALEYPQVAGLVLMSPYTSLPDLAKRRYFFVPVDLLMKDRFRNIDKMEDIWVPLLILHGKKDGIIPFSQAQSLYEKANMPKQFIAFPDAGHNDLYAHGAEEKIRWFLEGLL